MRRLIIGASVVFAAVMAARRFGPQLGQRAMAQCEAMFQRMPEDFPPKRMMRSIEEIRQQNRQILQGLAVESTPRMLTATK